MSFQAYLDNIKIKTGKTPADFKALARKKGLLEPGVKSGQIVSWLKSEFGLGHGHAMAVVLTLQSATAPKLSKDERLAAHFAGERERWQKPYEGLDARIRKFGTDVSAAPTKSYISLLRGGKKFGIVQVTAKRVDIGIKLKGAMPAGRFEPAGEWNSMVTLRIRISDPKQMDGELFTRLRLAYEQALS